MTATCCQLVDVPGVVDECIVTSVVSPSSTFRVSLSALVAEPVSLKNKLIDGVAEYAPQWQSHCQPEPMLSFNFTHPANVHGGDNVSAASSVNATYLTLVWTLSEGVGVAKYQSKRAANDHRAPAFPVLAM